ncbi:MAG: exosortase/archaeosortase family protein [Candidatus Diapherotrites archaeon]|uniref:Exosortase/archaeosortase family protein n=1 Tax=Candidatus Iainarchaeum sp. TaxID=3101447 RepID=A0A8T4C6U6_9ARCH|nr:exosortase/archaeosortase family protein [Candidatus Diapherotrites archaeon]
MLHTRGMELTALLREGILFLTVFAGLSIILYVVFSPLEGLLQSIVASHARSILHVIGTPTQTLNSIQFWAGNKLIEISPLCAGMMEMILLASVMMATRTVSRMKKIKGIVVGIALVYVFNLLRIVITVQQLIHASFSFAEFTHDWLFRGLLFVGLIGIYYAWLSTHSIIMEKTHSE